MADRVEFIISARDKYSKTMGSLTKMLPSLKTAAIATGAAIAGLGVALFALTKKTAESFDAVQKFSDQLGLSTEFLSSMQHAADLSGVAVGNMNKALQMLQVRVGEANRGIGQGKDAFDALGVSLRDASGQLHTAETILPRLADAFRNMSSATERAEAASKIFGQRGIAMLQILKDGSAGLAEMTAEAERFGLVVSAEAGARAAEFNDSLTRLKASFIGLRNTLATEIMPIITGLANRWADYIAQNREDITKWAFDFIKVVGNVAEYTGYAVAGMIDIWRGLEMTFHLLLAAAADFGAHFLEIFDTISGGTDRFIKFISDFAPALGVTGVAIEMLTRQWRENSSTTQEAVENLREFSSEQVKMLIDIVDTGSAIGRMNEYLQIFKDTIAEISAESFEREAGGIPPFTDANFAKAQEVRKNFEDMYTGSQNMLYDLGLMEFETFAEDLEKLQSTKLQSISALSQQTATLVGAFGKKAFALQKGVGIANATVSAYEAYNKNLAAFPFPFGPIMAALALATGLAQVAKIVALQPGGIAHGGLTNVPRESTFLLDRGERVLSPEQNRDLTEFLKAGGASINLDLTINTDQPLDRVDWDSLVEDDILPALTKLDKAGIKI